MANFAVVRNSVRNPLKVEWFSYLK